MMKWFILAMANIWLGILVFVFSPSDWPTSPNPSENGRYQLFESDRSPTLLLDTATGQTWYTSKCNDSDANSKTYLRIDSDCWLLMDKHDFSLASIKTKDKIK